MRLFIAFFILLLTISCNQETPTKNETPVTTEKVTTKKKLRHIVLFKFNETSAQSDIESIIQRFSELPSKIESIKGFEWGLNNSTESLNKEFTHAFFLSFDTQEGLDKYLPHSSHKEFVASIDTHVTDVLVFDYWVE